MDALIEALDTLAAERLDGAFGPALLERLGPLLTAANRLAAEVARTVRQCELTGAAEHDGLKTMVGWLRGHGHLAETEAARLVATGRALEHLPAVAAGFAEGMITAGQVGLIARIAEPERRSAAADRDIDLTAIDEALKLAAATQPFDTLKQAVGR